MCVIRKRAKLLLAKIYLGEDPKGDWDDTKKDMTISALFEIVWKEYWNKERFIQTGWNEKLKSTYKKHVSPEFATTPLLELSYQRIKKWHDTFSPSNMSAGNHALSCLSTMLTFARDREMIEYNHCSGIKRHKLPSRDRYAKPHELQKIISILDEILLDPDSGDHTGALFLFTILYTGARPTSIIKGDFDEVEIIDEDGKLYGIYQFNGKSSNKSGQQEKLIFPSALIEKYYAVGGHPFGSEMPRSLWAYIQQEVGCEDLWIRDLRRTFATVGLSSGISLDILSELLNHTNKQTTSIYAKLIDNAGVEAVESIANQLNKLKGVATCRD